MWLDKVISFTLLLYTRLSLFLTNSLPFYLSPTRIFTLHLLASQITRAHTESKFRFTVEILLCLQHGQVHINYRIY